MVFCFDKTCHDYNFDSSKVAFLKRNAKPGCNILLWCGSELTSIYYPRKSNRIPKRSIRFVRNDFNALLTSASTALLEIPIFWQSVDKSIHRFCCIRKLYDSDREVLQFPAIYVSLDRLHQSFPQLCIPEYLSDW